MAATVTPRTQPTIAERVYNVLQEATWPGEFLLATLQCSLNPGSILEKTFYVGMTPRRFLLVRSDQPERAYSIYRSFVHSTLLTGPDWMGQVYLRLELGGDWLVLKSSARWRESAETLADMHRQWDDEPLLLTSDQFLQQVADLADLGMLRIARSLLREQMATNPLVEIEPRAAELSRHIEQSRTALHAGALIFSLALGFMVVMSAFTNARLGVGLLLALVAAVGLLRGQLSGRGLALFIATLIAFGNGALTAMSGGLAETVMWASFGLSMNLVLLGRSSRARTLLSTAIFTLGLAALPAYHLLTGPSSASFADDFSKRSGWVEQSTDVYSSAVQDGAYHVRVNESGATFFAFPPVDFQPAQLRFDAWHPVDPSAGSGTYGAACGYMDEDQHYLVEIDSPRERFSVHAAGQAPDWKPLTGLREPRLPNRFTVRCTGGLISLSVNGLPQGRFEAPGLADGSRLGLFVSAGAQPPGAGYPVAFDNIELALSRR